MQDRCENLSVPISTTTLDILRTHTHLPCHIQLVVSHKVGVIALERIQNKHLVRLWDLRVREPPLVCQVHLRRNRPERVSRRLRVQLQIHRFRRLDPHDQLVPRNLCKNTFRHIFKLHSNLHLGLVQRCITPSCHSCVSLFTHPHSPLPAFRMNGTPSHLGFLIQSTVAANVGHTEFFGTVSSSRYPGFPFAATYCPKSVSSNLMAGIERNTLTYPTRVRTTLYDLCCTAHLFVPDIFRAKRHRPLHRQDTQHLQQISTPTCVSSFPHAPYAALTVLQNISDDTKFVKVSATAFCTKWLLERDLNIVDRVSVPRSVHGHVPKP